jgi:hypothetical protein
MHGHSTSICTIAVCTLGGAACTIDDGAVTEIGIEPIIGC